MGIACICRCKATCRHSMLRKFTLTALPPPGDASYIGNKDVLGVLAGRQEQAEGVWHEH